MASMNFWDFKQSQGRKKNAPDPASKPVSNSSVKAISVTELSELIDGALKGCLPTSLLVKGEISNYRPHAASGHLYFTLKDARACIDCVMFRSDAGRLKFKPADGMELIVTGRVGLYAERGRYQFYVTSVTPVGQGALELARQQIEAKLRAEGLFDDQRKKPLPKFPRRIALVTSTNTAAIQDILKVLRRFPFLHVMAYHVPVQGDGAAQKMAAAVAALNSSLAKLGGVDVIILGRGGGSLEDLWEFNEEALARAVAASKIPIVSGIGHEIDVSIADLVADYHAHTPTEAAQVVTRHWRNVIDRLAGAGMRLRRELKASIDNARHRLMAVERRELFARPLDYINRHRQRLDDLQETLDDAVEARVHRGRERLARIEARLRGREPGQRLRLDAQCLGALAGQLNRTMARLMEKRLLELTALSARLECVNPEEVLKRGYCITLVKKSGEIVRDPAQVRPGDTLITRLTSGEIQSVVEDARQLKLFE